MRIFLNVVYFFVFMVLAFGAMFVGGVSGVAGSFYLMVKEGNIEDNLFMGIATLAVALILAVILRGQNIKVMRQRKQAEQNIEASETEAEEG